jgi:hypothetical protein
MGRAGGHDQSLARERSRTAGIAKDRQRRRGDLERLGHAADAGFARFRHLAGVRADHGDAVGDELRQVAPCRRVRPHVRVHGGRDQHRLVRRQQDRRREIAGVAARHPGRQVGGRRRHHDQIGVARQPNVADVELARRIEQLGKRALAGQCAGRQWCDEFLRRLGENAAHDKPALLQPANEVERFVGGNAAADDQQHAPRGAGMAHVPLIRLLLRRAARPFAGGSIADSTVGRVAQDRADLVLHRAAMARRAQAQALLQVIVELPDGDAGHRFACLVSRAGLVLAA